MISEVLREDADVFNDSDVACISLAQRTICNGHLVMTLGSITGWGAVVTSASSKVIVEGYPLARNGDSAVGPLHGQIFAVTGSNNAISG